MNVAMLYDQYIVTINLKNINFIIKHCRIMDKLQKINLSQKTIDEKINVKL